MVTFCISSLPRSFQGEEICPFVFLPDVVVCIVLLSMMYSGKTQTDWFWYIDILLTVFGILQNNSLINYCINEHNRAQ